MFVRVHAPGQAPDFLEGRYSESFLFELSRQIECEIKRVMSVEGLENSKIELQLVFAPGTYMEHTSENVTYRRLLLIDDASRPRDFWVKWTRLDGGAGYTVSDDVTADSIRFELGEDVPQKIREKEFRFLCSANPDKYQAAMGKKKATEWRDIIKRAIKYGLVTKFDAPVYVPTEIPKAEPILPRADEVKRDEPVDEISLKLKELLALEENEPEEDEPVNEESFDSIVELARAALLKYGEDEQKEETDALVLDAEEELEVEEEPEDEQELEAPFDTDDFSSDFLADELVLDTPTLAEDELFIPDTQTEAFEPDDEIIEPKEEIIEAEELVLTEAYTEPAPVAAPVVEAVPEPINERDIRAELEAKIRLEYEMRAREMAELMAAERERHERKLAEAEEKERRANEELQRTIEAQLQREARERDRLAEAARQAVLEQRQLEREKIPEPEKPVAEPALAPVEEPVKAPAPVTFQEEKPREPEWLEPKHARLIFRNTVPVNAISAIKSIVEKTLISEGKEQIEIHMRAYPIDGNTVGMDILKMPASEKDLLVTIMKALGRGGLGIVKITLE